MRRGTQKERHDLCRVFLFGGDEEDRTLDLTDANRTLSQLSYAPKQDNQSPSFILPQVTDFVKGFLQKKARLLPKLTDSDCFFGEKKSV